jgi:hypothetical protein
MLKLKQGYHTPHLGSSARQRSGVQWFVIVARCFLWRFGGKMAAPADAGMAELADA